MKRKLRFLACANNRRKLAGVLTYSDITKWLISDVGISLETRISEIYNKNPITITEGASSDEIRKCLEVTPYVPVVDSNKHVIAIAMERGNNSFKIGNFDINKNSNSLIIAEIGNNHNGNINHALRLIDLAKESGADCVKFQMRDLVTLYESSNSLMSPGKNLGTEYTLDLLEKFQLDNEELLRAMSYAKDQGLLPLWHSLG